MNQEGDIPASAHCNYVLALRVRRLSHSNCARVASESSLTCLFLELKSAEEHLLPSNRLNRPASPPFSARPNSGRLRPISRPNTHWKMQGRKHQATRADFIDRCVFHDLSAAKDRLLKCIHSLFDGGTRLDDDVDKINLYRYKRTTRHKLRRLPAELDSIVVEPGISVLWCSWGNWGCFTMRPAKPIVQDYLSRTEFIFETTLPASDSRFYRSRSTQ
jgi:hypothetical protein